MEFEVTHAYEAPLEQLLEQFFDETLIREKNARLGARDVVVRELPPRTRLGQAGGGTGGSGVTGGAGHSGQFSPGVEFGSPGGALVPKERGRMAL